MILDHLAAEETASREAVIRSVLAEYGGCIKILDLEGRLQVISDGAQHAIKRHRFRQVQGTALVRFLDGCGKRQARKAVKSRTVTRRRTSEAPRIRQKAIHDTGMFAFRRYWDRWTFPSATFGFSRRYPEWRIAADLREATERQRIIADELQHRIKKALAMVSAIANQTMRGDDVDAARNAFAARLVTLGHAHDILTQTSWLSAPIREVVEGALAPHKTADSRIKVSGTDLRLCRAGTRPSWRSTNLPPIRSSTALCLTTLEPSVSHGQHQLTKRIHHSYSNGAKQRTARCASDTNRNRLAAD